MRDLLPRRDDQETRQAFTSLLELLAAWIVADLRKQEKPTEDSTLAPIERDNHEQRSP
jgi:hypothetical protein